MPITRARAKQLIANVKTVERRRMRDDFAKYALMGSLASPPLVDRTKVNKALLAAVAYEFSDAMIAEREIDRPRTKRIKR